MKKLLALLLLAAALCAHAETLVWDSPKETNITHHLVYTSTDGGVTFPLTNQVNMPATSFPLTLETNKVYLFHVTAVNDRHLESGPAAVTYTKISTPPQIDVTNVTIGSHRAGAWRQVKVWFNEIELQRFGATNYIVKAERSTGTTVVTETVSSPATFSSLTVADYVFSVYASNSAGLGPQGATFFVSGKSPGNPTGVIVQP